jgi:hypothetical protein
MFVFQVLPTLEWVKTTERKATWRRSG